jgi:Na+-translocating ferredoxin:NAD+ oxidoreductase RnfG subunit
MDAFKITLAVAVLISLAILGGIFFITQNAIANSRIPEVQKGLVVIKTIVEDDYPANYSVTLESGKILYISSNLGLYESILVNKTYQFDCWMDFKQKITIIETATIQTE